MAAVERAPVQSAPRTPREAPDAVARRAVREAMAGDDFMSLVHGHVRDLLDGRALDDGFERLVRRRVRDALDDDQFLRQKVRRLVHESMTDLLGDFHSAAVAQLAHARALLPDRAVRGDPAVHEAPRPQIQGVHGQPTDFVARENDQDLEVVAQAPAHLDPTADALESALAPPPVTAGAPEAAPEAPPLEHADSGGVEAPVIPLLLKAEPETLADEQEPEPDSEPAQPPEPGSEASPDAEQAPGWQYANGHE